MSRDGIVQEENNDFGEAVPADAGQSLFPRRDIKAEAYGRCAAEGKISKGQLAFGEISENAKMHA